MKRQFLSIGGMPEKVSNMNFDLMFRQMTERMLDSFSNAMNKLYPEGNYPISEYMTDDSLGVQIALESDEFVTELFILRRHVNGYTLIVLTEGSDNEGVFEYDFEEDDSLSKVIQNEIAEALKAASNN